MNSEHENHQPATDSAPLRQTDPWGTETLDGIVAAEPEDTEQTYDCPCPPCRADIDRFELELVWALTPHQLFKVLDGATEVGRKVHRDEMPRYWVELRHTALHLILDASAGPATSASEFLARCDADVLRSAWSRTGGYSDLNPLAVDALIKAVSEPDHSMLSLVAAEFYNLFRQWAADPAKARKRVASFGIADTATPITQG